MRKVFYLLLIACILASCIGKKRPAVDHSFTTEETSEVIDKLEVIAALSESNIESEIEITCQPTVTVDTLILNFTIKYQIKDNEDVVIYDNRSADIRYICRPLHFL